MTGPRPAALAALTIALALSGCARDPESAVRDATESALSWASSAHFAVEGWTDRRLSTRFTRAALERCQRGLEETRAPLATGPLLGQPRVPEAARAIAQMSALVAALAEAVGKDDRAGAARSAADLAAAAARLRDAGGP